MPLQGIESHLSDIGKAHVDWLVAQNKYAHCGNPIFGTDCSAAFSSPTQRVQSNVPLVDGWERNNENLGLATASDSASSFILMIHEYTIFNLLYRDASVTWGHRNNLLQALIDNFGPQGSEGFLGVAETFAAGYNPFNRANTNFGKVVAYEIYDPAQGAMNAFSVTDLIKLDTTPTKKFFRLVSKSNGRPLSIAKSLTTVGAAIVQDSMADLANQKWRMDSTSNGYVKFVSVLTGQAIDVRWGGKRQGIRVNQWTSSASSSQEWKIEAQTDGSVKLINRNSSLALTVPNTPTKGNHQAVQLKSAPFYNQSFQLVPTN